MTVVEPEPEAEDEGAIVLLEVRTDTRGDASVVVPLDVSSDEELLTADGELLAET